MQIREEIRVEKNDKRRETSETPLLDVSALVLMLSAQAPSSSSYLKKKLQPQASEASKFSGNLLYYIDSKGNCLLFSSSMNQPSLVLFTERKIRPLVKKKKNKYKYISYNTNTKEKTKILPKKMGATGAPRSARM